MGELTMHETKTHGTISFPYAVYKVDIPDCIRSFPLHWHDEMELIYVGSGRGAVTVQSRRYDVQEGDIAIVLPQTVHAIEQSGDSSMRYFNILFDFSLFNYSANDGCYDKYFKPFYTHAKLLPPIAERGGALNRAMTDSVKYLVDNRHEIDGDELMIRSKLFEIMHVLNVFGKESTPSDLSTKNNYDKLKNLLLYVRSHYDRDIGVKEAAEICWFSPSHFMKLFKEMTGKSFTQYLIDYRLEVAAEQLAETNDKIIDIATGVGFDNTSYFSRAFADRYGLTPTEYRRVRRSESGKRDG